MSAEGLRKAVLQKARAEAEEILARARDEADAALDSARTKAEREAADAVENARRESRRARERALSALEREMRLKALEEKNRLLDEAFSRAAREFARLPAEDLRTLYEEEFEGPEIRGATVRVPPGAREEFKSLLGGTAAVEEDPSVEAGYVVVGEEFRLDRSLRARLEELKAELRAELARMLFSESE